MSRQVIEGHEVLADCGKAGREMTSSAGTLKGPTSETPFPSYPDSTLRLKTNLDHVLGESVS